MSKIITAATVHPTAQAADHAARRRAAAGEFSMSRVFVRPTAGGFTYGVTSSDIDRDMIRLAMRPEGATRRDFAACAATQQPWTDRVKLAAARFDFEYSSTPQGRGVVYHLREYAAG